MTERSPAAQPRTWRTLDLIRVTIPYLESKGVDSPRLCAEILLAHVLACPRINLYTQFEKALSDDVVSRFRELVRRRAAREPIQHLTGRTEFWSLPIRCDARALVPRPETELIVATALDLLRDRADPAVADLGTGTACIAIALAKELPDASVVASDISADALALAQENIKAHGLDGRILLLEGDFAAPFLAKELGNHFDAVVSNPPYIPDEELDTLQPEVRDFDPRMALSGGADGLDSIRKLLDEARTLLKLGGFLIMEVGHGQSTTVTDLLTGNGWQVERTVTDGGGIERVLVAQYTSESQETP